MRRVIIESPYASDVQRHLKYLRACMRDCLVNRGESPFASHALYTQPQVLDDEVAEERKLGITAGFEWRRSADLTVFYVDCGWSSGMHAGYEDCIQKCLPFTIRLLGKDWDK